jgi:asparagine synthase (glutamine-hydrolysing)
MLDSIRHRGPDDEGLYAEPGVGLGHRRLSIIDLNAGHQPLCNEDGTVWIVFNGEIYNFHELRLFLLSKGHVFKTQTDTEVIVHLYEEVGPRCLEELRGMFAFAIWDANTRTLFIARDRVGIKPLYYYLSNESLVFGSEIKAILADPSVSRQLSPEMIDRFFTFLYLPGEDTLLKGVQKLAPGCYAVLRNGKFKIHQYWDISFSKPFETSSAKKAEAELLDLLAEAVELHMIADVPVGVLLSGGVDSTAVLSLAAERTDKEISTYTVGFSEPGITDERPYARLAAEAYGARHHELTISAADFATFLPRYVWHMEEPVCEPPAIALYYVSLLAQNDVKVLLSGEGGDEAFAGYGIYRNLVWLERAKRIPSLFLGGAARAAAAVTSLYPLPAVARYLPLMSAQFPSYYYSRTSNPFCYSGGSLGDLYSPDFAAAIDREHSLEPVRKLWACGENDSVLDRMLFIDTKTWLPDDLLIKADKMTMANSVELRVPLLDHKVLEFAAALPSNLKIRGFRTKYLAKKALGSRVPKAILDRPKVGFPVPYDSWLRKDLRGLVHDLLFDRSTTNRGHFDTRAVGRLVDRNEKAGGYSKEIFCLMTLELWQRSFLAAPTHIPDLNCRSVPTSV